MYAVIHELLCPGGIMKSRHAPFSSWRSHRKVAARWSASVDSRDVVMWVCSPLETETLRARDERRAWNAELARGTADVAGCVEQHALELLRIAGADDLASGQVCGRCAARRDQVIGRDPSVLGQEHAALHRVLALAR